MNEKLFLRSLNKTLPLNVEMNLAFGNVQYGEVCSLDPHEIFELVNKLKKQVKLVAHEIEETIGEIDERKILDGIGDIITTADGYIGLYSSLERVKFLIENSPFSLSLWDGNFDECMSSTLLDLYDSCKGFESVVEARQKPNLVNSLALEKRLYAILNWSSDLIVAVRYSVDFFSRHLGYCPVKILKEVQKSNMSKLCVSREVAEQTVASYGQKGIPADYLVIEESPLAGKFAVKIAKEITFKGQLLPVGKFMKSIDFVKPDFSDLNSFLLEDESWVIRMEAKLADLVEKETRLSTFLDENFDSLTPEIQQLMKDQRSHLGCIISNLTKRISLAG